MEMTVKNVLLIIFGCSFLCLFLGFGVFETIEFSLNVRLPFSWSIALSIVFGAIILLIMVLSGEKKEEREERMPKSFLKKCIKCGKQIPLASEECQYCGSIQY